MGTLLESKKLTEPPFGYFSSVYMTILSVIQSIAIVGIISEANKHFTLSLSGTVDWRWTEYLAVGVVIATLWHKYVSHHQFIGWQLSLPDTLLVALFGFVEAQMVFTLADSKAQGRVHLFIAVMSLIGFFAYYYAKRCIRDPYVKRIYDEHYEKNSDEMYEGMVGFELMSQRFTFKLTSILAVFAILGLREPELSPIISLLSVAVFFYYLWKWDIRRLLLNNKEWELLRDRGKNILRRDLSKRGKSDV